MKTAIVLGIIIGCIGLTFYYPKAMISPGNLIEGHYDLNNKCLSCHNLFTGIPNEKCISCHKIAEIGKDSLHKKDPGEKRFKILFHQYLSGQKCTSCHTEHKGLLPDSLFGNFKHEMLDQTIINECSSCHNKPVDTLHKFVSAACNNCHKTNDWKSSTTFNHDMIQGMAKNNCTSCHQKPNDTYHQLLNTNCDKCHSTSKWIPSTFDHSKYFPLDRNHTTKCNTCHSENNFTAYTCYGCHEHSESRMISKHSEEGIYNISKCASCHKSANEHDIQRNENNNEGLNRNDVNKVNDYLKKKEDGKKKNDDN